MNDNNEQVVEDLNLNACEAAAFEYPTNSPKPLAAKEVVGDPDPQRSDVTNPISNHELARKDITTNEDDSLDEWLCPDSVRNEQRAITKQRIVDSFMREMDAMTSWAGYFRDGYIAEEIPRLAAFLKPYYPDYKLICVWDSEEWTGTCGDSNLHFLRNEQVYDLPDDLWFWLFEGDNDDQMPTPPAVLEPTKGDYSQIMPSIEEPEHNFVFP
jgi:hypothetical protein